MGAAYGQGSLAHWMFHSHTVAGPGRQQMSAVVGGEVSMRTSCFPNQPCEKLEEPIRLVTWKE